RDVVEIGRARLDFVDEAALQAGWHADEDAGARAASSQSASSIASSPSPALRSAFPRAKEPGMLFDSRPWAMVSHRQRKGRLVAEVTFDHVTKTYPDGTTAVAGLTLDIS